MKKKIVVVLTIAALVLGLVAGILGTKLLGSGGSGSSGGEAVGSYIYNEATGNAMGDNDYVEYELTLYADNTYKLTASTSSCGYGMLLSNTVTSAYGAYTMGASEDGYTSCELSEATRIVYNGYSDVGGFNMSYDTDSLQFPVELPGGIMTERDDFWAQFGPARTVSLDDTNNNRMTLDTGAAPPIFGGNDGGGEAEPDAAPEPDVNVPSGEGVTVTSDDGATTLTFYSNGTYRFFFEQFDVEDIGTYTYESGALTVTNANGLELTADGDPMALHYVTSVSDQLTGDFTISAADLGT